MAMALALAKISKAIASHPAIFHGLVFDIEPSNLCGIWQHSLSKQRKASFVTYLRSLWQQESKDRKSDCSDFF